MLISFRARQERREKMWLGSLLTWLTKVTTVINIRELLQRSLKTPLLKKCDFKHLALGIC